MAKRGFRRSSNRWEDTLPKEYATIPAGFHAKMTVQEMVNFLELVEDIQVPEKIRNIELTCFTPELFSDPAFENFWKTPVSSYHLKDGGKRELVFSALNDPDVRKVQKEVGYDMDVVHPDLETLARLAQTQYLGFRLRLSELSSSSMLSRLEKLQNPAHYQDIRKVAQDRFEVALPDKAPAFKMVKSESSVKRIGSALGKAYHRTGKPKNSEAFFQKPQQYGINGVNDMLRSTIKFLGDKARDTSHFMAVRNLLAVASLSGKMAFLPTEMTDQVLYPKENPERSSEKVPVVMFKGLAAHTGAEGSVVTLPVEIQLQFLSDQVSEDSHRLYAVSRNPYISEDKKAEAEMARDALFHAAKTTEMHNITRHYHETGRMDAGWEHISSASAAFYMRFNMSSMTTSLTKNCPGPVRKAVQKCVREEFPEEYKQNDTMIDLTLDNLQHPTVMKSLNLMICEDKNYEPKPEHRRTAGQRSSLLKTFGENSSIGKRDYAAASQYGAVASLDI